MIQVVVVVDIQQLELVEEEQDGGGGDHQDGGGGFCGGSSRKVVSTVQNGGTIGDGAVSGPGGSYYVSGVIDEASNYANPANTAMVGGQGGIWGVDGNQGHPEYDHNGNEWCRFSGGCGGIAGNGGTIKITNEVRSKLKAYNGDANTTGNHSQTISEYTVTLGNWSNTDTTKISTTMPVNNSNLVNIDIAVDNNTITITPTKIFAQAGICRETYNYNQADKNFDLNHILMQHPGWYKSKNCLSTPAKTVTAYQQGIGSGAGYYENSNGSFETKTNEEIKQFIQTL